MYAQTQACLDGDQRSERDMDCLVGGKWAISHYPAGICTGAIHDTRWLHVGAVYKLCERAGCT